MDALTPVIAGNVKAARITITEMTTRSSIRVKAGEVGRGRSNLEPRTKDRGVVRGAWSVAAIPAACLLITDH
jgi:hypothetical protein